VAYIVPLTIEGQFSRERAMAVAVKRLTPHFAAEVHGVDISESVPDGDFEEIQKAFDEHSILVFRDQDITDDQQVAFSQRFGALETTVNSNPGGAGTVVTILSNLDEDGAVIPPTDRRMVFNTGNQMWHTDSSFKEIPATGSLLSGRQVPSGGGETEFASMRAGFDALSDDRKKALEGLVCVHDFAYSRALIDPNLLRTSDKQELPPIRQALVRTNPATGRENLFLGAHASYVEGMDLEDGRALIRELNAHVTQPAFVYRHEWRKHDLVMWDNRCALHRGRPWNPVYPRVMHRTTVAGIGRTA
jgi:alpha-ketoglutarate-dependent 2,4-dichlorophenoxyacetate dioxygenase